ncbi:hypothetical protein [Agrobacterium tumefaciens]|uniref:hypothetical protein n=1 Tax=Agrobacterium tumefaciens TaxID=358 RepID=UPI00287F2627|nr:hypothetical protein [Agrobacterium tumefaciens]MDS7597095.1 hypothetical protein [Agrobacterium tumefaciens]
MKDLIELFWLRYTELQSAVGNNEANKIAVLERELEQLLDRIAGRQTESSEEIREQFRFAIDLLNHEAEDLGCVQRNSEILRTLVDRYVGLSRVKSKSKGDDEGDTSSFEWQHRHLIFDEDMMSDLGEPVVVVSPGYRVAYANGLDSFQRNAPEGLVGCHIAELVGVHRFQNDLREKLDNCFKGDGSKYTYAEDSNGHTVVKSLQMSPCYSSSYKLVGAMVVIREIADRRRRAMA